MGTKLSALPEATSHAANDIVAMVVSGVTKKVQASNLDAGKVSAFGIGTDAVNLGAGYDLDDLDKNGFFFVPSGCGHGPGGATDNVYIISYQCSAASPARSQIGWGAGVGAIKYSRSRYYLGSWLWDTWDAFTGNNGGQPPAPKPTTGTPAGGANSQGQRLSGSVIGGDTLYYSGGTNLAGTWDIVFLDSIVASQIVANFASGVGSGAVGAVESGHIVFFVTTRVA